MTKHCLSETPINFKVQPDNVLHVPAVLDTLSEWIVVHVKQLRFLQRTARTVKDHAEHVAATKKSKDPPMVSVHVSPAMLAPPTPTILPA